MHYLSGVNALFGIWVGISPWVFGYSDNPGATTSAVIIGAVILVLGAIRFVAGFTPQPQPAPAVGMGMGMGDMVGALVRAPEGQREVMLAERLRQFAAQSEVERQAGMKTMLAAALRLPREDYTRLAASRLKVLMSLPDSDQMRLMKTHVAVLKQLPEAQQMTEMGVMKELLMGMPERQRQTMAQMMSQAGMQMAM